VRPRSWPTRRHERAPSARLTPGPRSGDRADLRRSIGGGGGRSAEPPPFRRRAADTGRFNDRRFPRGYLPDPRIDEGRAGGSIGVGLIGGGCRGRVEAQPNHVVELRDPFDYFRIEIEAEEGATSLIVRTPSGGHLCGAPDEGPTRVERDEWMAGRYRIWVGRRDREATPEYRIIYSETLAPRP
jgi:hypothetical protein